MNALAASVLRALPGGPFHGSFAQLVISRRAVPINAGAAADHPLLVLSRAPGEAKRRLEFLGVVHRRSQIVRAGSENRRQERRLGQIGIVEAGLRIPCQPVIDCEVGSDLPDILEVRPVLVVILVLIVVVGRRAGKRRPLRRR